MHYKNVQGMRAIAACLVVIAHSGGIMYVPWSVIRLGQSGVDIFFVISGFIVCQVAARQRDGTLNFLVRRLWRIFPLYWIVLAFSALLAACGLSLDITHQHFEFEYALLLTTENPYLPQAWTLVFELYFYGSLAFVLLAAPAGRFFRALGLWILFQTVLIVAIWQTDGAPVVNAISLEFGLGCAVAWLTVRGWIRYELLAFVCGLVLFASADWLFAADVAITQVHRLITFGAGAALCIYALVGLERRGAVIFPGAVVRLGDASYSLYLWHLPLLFLVASIGIRKAPALAIVFVVAFASYYLIEIPLLKVGRRLTIDRRLGAGVVPI